MSDRYINDCPYCGGAGIEDLIVQHMPDGSTEETHIEAFLPDELQAMLDRGAVIQRDVACEDCNGTGELDRSDDPEFVALIDEGDMDDTIEIAKQLEHLTDEEFDTALTEAKKKLSEDNDGETA
ncbi:hypothetical protein LCGC14_2111130 [marine sediment metagenome]|uniref:Uncharacterized protein n=1 Tax=marine sediment metagenome TaxID=412755 RepID=A0A0F9E746_9ZZZZ